MKLFIANFLAYLNLSENPLVEFVQVLYMPNQERTISGVYREQHVWTLVPLYGQSLHLPFQ